MRFKPIGKSIVKWKGVKAFVVICSCFIHSSIFSQTVSLSLRNEPIEKAFKIIETQTAYRFIYSKESISTAKRVSIQLSGISLRDALPRLFSGQPLQYSIEDIYIMVKAKEENSEKEPGKTITGRVSDEEDKPLQDVTVTIKGTTLGTVTDERGEYSLQDVNDNATLVFSYVGMESVQVPVKGRSSISVHLTTISKTLDETVIKGYYSTSKRFNTGNVVKISSEEIGRQPVSNPLAALEGQVPGLFITQRNGMSGSDFDVLIRGRNSIQNGTEPLYIIDGVPFPSDRLTQLNLFSAGNVFNSINPRSIESIEVLKDADATAIYGSRGANGVIIITTKKGVSGKTGLEVNIYKGWGKTNHRLDLMNTQQYLEMRNEAFRNDRVTPTTANARDLMAWDTTRYTEWKNYIIGGTAHITDAQLSFSGGNEAVRFLVSGAYYKGTTVFPGNFGNQRSTLNFSLVNNSRDKKFNSQISIGLGRDENNLPQRDLTSLITLPPNTPELKDSLGRLLFSKNGFGFTNPLAVALQRYKVTTERLTGNIQLSYHVLPGLGIKSSFGYNLNRSSELSQLPIASQNPVLNPKGSSSFGNNEVSTWIVEPQLEYSSKLGTGGKMEFILGSSFQQNESNYRVIRGEGYTNDNLLNSTVGAASTTSQVGNSQYRYHALYTRLGLEFYKRYLLNLTARRDGSSRFGPGKQFANFGAAGAGWIFSEEKILKGSRVLSFGKLRGSYGITGNQPIADYQYLDTWSGVTYPYGGQPGLQPSRIFNPDYSWEQIRKLELSLELGFNKDRFFLSSTWFKNRSSNQIVSYTLPAQTGFSNVIMNFPGVVQNAGFEFSLTSKTINRQEYSWTTSVNLTISKNKLVSFPGLASSAYATSYEIGKPLNNFRGYHYLGIDPQTGIYRFEDINKDNSINTLDYIYGGTTNPEWYGGMTNSLRYKSVRLSFLLQVVKQLGMEPVYSSFVASGTMLNNRPVLALDRWQKSGDRAKYQKYSQNFGGPVVNPATNNIGRSDAVLVDASYARLRNLSLEWSLPDNRLQKMKLDMLVFYLQAQNLLTFTSYHGPDPEVQAINALPPLKIISAGIKFSF